MKKILLIEDKVARQHDFLNKINLDLSTYSDVLENKIGKEYKDFHEKMKRRSFNFSDYALVVSHKSAFSVDTQDVIFNITKECKEKNIPMVLFSGGIGCSSYRKDEDEEILELDSKDFYSENLKLFLKNYQDTARIELLILNFGDRWKLNVILNVIEKINLFINDDNVRSHIIYNKFINKTDFHLLEEFEFDHIPIVDDEDIVELVELKKLALSIEKYIKESVLYEK